VSNVSVDFADPDRPTVSWQTDGTVEADVLEFVADWPDGYWWVRTPPDFASPVRAPEIPDELEAWRPPVSATVEVEYEERNHRIGYDDERNANWILDPLPGEWSYRYSSGESAP
jgi:hypothetical protein